MEYTGAYRIQGDAATLGALIDQLERDRIIERGHPDLYLRAYRSFGIDDAQEIRTRAASRPMSAERRVFALSIPNPTTEAQNALLKTIEEPSAGALFFIVTPSPETLLATIRSRTQTLDIEATEREALVDAKSFLAAPQAKRVEMLKPLYEHDDEGRDMGAIIGFLSSVERQLAEEKNIEKRNEGLRALYRARKYASDKGSLLKSLLEQLALLAPKI